MARVTWPHAILALATSIAVATATVVGLSVGSSAVPATEPQLRASDSSAKSTGPLLGPVGVAEPAVSSTFLPTSGNSFSSPVVLTGYWPNFVFDSTAATNQSGEPRKLGAGWYVTRTMWAKWKAPASGLVSVFVSGGITSDNVGVNVYRGSSLGGLTRVAWNDDQYNSVDGAAGTNSPPAGFAEILSLRVVKGTTYRFQVGSALNTSSGVAAGFSALNLFVIANRYLPSNDDFDKAAAVPLPASRVLDWTTVLNGSTMEDWEPRDNDEYQSVERIGSIWYKWTPPVDADVTVTTCADFGGPSLAFFSNWDEEAGVGSGDLAALGYDYANGVCGPDREGADLSQPMLKGVTYFIQVAGSGNSLRDVDLHFEATYLDPYIEKISPMSGSHAGGNTVTITGQQFTKFGGTPVVKFGSKTATIVGIPTDIQITVKAPSHAIGSVNVTVTVNGEISNTRKYTYK